MLYESVLKYVVFIFVYLYIIFFLKKKGINNLNNLHEILKTF